MLEGRTGRTTACEFPRNRRDARKNSDSNPTKPSPSRSKLTFFSQKAFDWSLERSHLFCGCVSVDPFEREIILKKGAGLNGPLEIHVEVEKVVKSDVMWRDPVEAVLFERYPAVDTVSARIWQTSP